MAVLAYMVLHNLCVENSDGLSEIFNLTMHPVAHQKRNRETIRDLLLIKTSRNIIDPEKNEAVNVRQTATESCIRNTRTLASEQKCLLKIALGWTSVDCSFFMLYDFV